MDTGPADIALAAFALCNSIRVFAYVPQIVSVARDRNGATAISYTTWGLFALSHLSTVAYAILTLDDWRMAAVFAANAACCTIVLGLTALKRARVKPKAGGPLDSTGMPPPQHAGSILRGDWSPAKQHLVSPGAAWSLSSLHARSGLARQHRGP
jgi:uncharacterized protein with PQ loop repeat